MKEFGFKKAPKRQGPSPYIMKQPLLSALKLAYALGQPLLLTGDPGTGKTQFAFEAARLLSEEDARFADKPLRFNTKTSSIAKDLFYSYDALSHFQASNIRREEKASTSSFIQLQALGTAIAQSNPAELLSVLPKEELQREPRSSVVLIDEIDKAPRDFCNDVLNEIENYEFSIPELSFSMKKAEDQEVLIILTSNSEKNLPDAFLRRCVFYHIPFPDEDQLVKILEAHLLQPDGKIQYGFEREALKLIISEFNKIRSKSTRKPAATAELVAWVRILGMHHFMELENKDKQIKLMHSNLSVLVKTKDDLVAVKDLVKQTTS